MLSFKTLIAKDIRKLNITKRRENLVKIKNLLLEYGEGNVAVCSLEEAVLIRIFDGYEYSFLYPKDLCDDKASQIIELIAEYAVREEIGLLIRSVPKDALSLVAGSFCYADVRCEDVAGGLYSVRMRSEADIIGKVPTVKGGAVTLCAIRERDIPDYAGVCRDESSLHLWGYDYREDEPKASDEYFYNIQLSEFCRGVSMTFAVKQGRKLIGEASFYAFDYKGGAEIGFRLLPEYRGKGLGRATLEALLLCAEEIGLNTLYATVDKRNTASIKLISGYMDKAYENEKLIHFILKGEE